MLWELENQVIIPDGLSANNKATANGFNYVSLYSCAEEISSDLRYFGFFRA